MIIWEAWMQLQECRTCIRQAQTCYVAVDGAAHSSEVNPFFFFFQIPNSVRNRLKQPRIGPIWAEISVFKKYI